MIQSVSKKNLGKALVFKKRLMVYQNPVEFVNNMYGCHPNDLAGTYFQAIYK